MGRQLKRVPLDWNWPLNKTWVGFLNPFDQFQVECSACEGTGESPQSKKLSQQWYGYIPFNPQDRGSTPFSIDHPVVLALATKNVERCLADGYMTGPKDLLIKNEATRLCDQCFNNHWSHHLNDDDVRALVKADRLMDFTHTFVRNKDGSGQWIKNKPLVIPSAKQVNEWSLSGLGHDSLNQWVVVKAECKRKGLPIYCPICKGKGHTWASQKAKRLAASWKNIQPPKGPGFQLWETTSDGSPISPVFSSLETLCQWCEKNATTFGSEKTSAADWMKMLNKNFVTHTKGNLTFM